MIEEIKNFRKDSSVVQIKDFLEQKFKVDLSYRAVYVEFRKVFPLFGPDDATIFMDWCQENNFIIKKHINVNEKFYTKLFISSPLMRTHFDLYGDIVIMDSTYRVNKYKLPIVLFSGFTYSGKKCLFGIGIVNNETRETYEWLLSQFFEAHPSRCHTVVTDHDLSVEAVLNTEYRDKTHILCKWHVAQSFIKNFSFLSSTNCGALKNKILSLIEIQSEEEFKNVYTEIKDTLESRKFAKSVNYIEKMYSIKEKWAEAFLPRRFTGGVHSTSRAESMNSLMKRYVSSKSEISDIIRFLGDFERKFAFEEIEISKEISSQYETHPIIRSLREKVFGLIYNQHFYQFTLSHNYNCKLKRSSFEDTSFEIRSMQAKDINKFRQVKLSLDKYTCECPSYYRHGLICRHIFAVAIMSQDKTCDKFLIHKRWQPPMNDINFQTTNDDSNFNTDKIKAYLNEKETQGINTQDLSEDKNINDVVFRTQTKSKGAPKKEKRLKNAIEKNSSVQKKTPKKSTNKNYYHILTL